MFQSTPLASLLSVPMAYWLAAEPPAASSTSGPRPAAASALCDLSSSASAESACDAQAGRSGPSTSSDVARTTGTTPTLRAQATLDALT